MKVVKQSLQALDDGEDAGEDYGGRERKEEGEISNPP